MGSFSFGVERPPAQGAEDTGPLGSQADCKHPASPTAKGTVSPAGTCRRPCSLLPSHTHGLRVGSDVPSARGLLSRTTPLPEAAACLSFHGPEGTKHPLPCPGTMHSPPSQAGSFLWAPAGHWACIPGNHSRWEGGDPSTISAPSVFSTTENPEVCHAGRSNESTSSKR